MFGFYRTMLALWVMIFHLVAIPVIGLYAVFSFFILSGFLMTTIMHESYGYTQTGLRRYAINRFLRLYPMYWAVITISVLSILLVGASYASGYKTSLYIPDTWSGIISNVAMIFPATFPNDIDPRLAPPTWALTIEIFFYICIGLGLSKSKRITLIWVASSVLYYIGSYVFELHWKHRYASVFAASLPFSLGALLYFYKEEVFSYIEKLRVSSPLLLLTVYIANAGIFTLHDYFNPFPDAKQAIADVGQYLNIGISFFIVASLFYRGHEIFSKKIDKTLGDYSYPIYLVHWQAGLIASFILFDTPTKGLHTDGIISFALSLALVFAMSFILIELIDKNVSRVRNRIKAGR